MFVFLNIIFLLLYAFAYLRFRGGLYCAFRISRKKKRKGFQNYWFFKSHFQIGAIHKAYYINKGFIFAWCFVLSITVFLGFVAIMRPVIIVLIGLLGVCLVPMCLWGMEKSNLQEYGTPFVLISKHKIYTGRRHSSIPEAFMICMIPFVPIIVDLAIMGVI